MPQTCSYHIHANSKIPLIASITALVDSIMLIIVYWPIYVQYFSAGKYAGIPTTGLMIVFYSILIFSMLLYAIFTVVFAKKSTIWPALFAIPISLFYVLDIIGLRQTILFFDLDNVFWYYRTNTAYFSDAWPFVVVLALFSVAAAVFFTGLAFHKAKNRLITVMITGAAAVIWLAYAIYRFTAFDYPLYVDAAVTGRDLVYSVVSLMIVVSFFWTQFLLSCAMKPVQTQHASADMPEPESANAVSPQLIYEESSLPDAAADACAIQPLASEYDEMFSRDAADLPDHLAEEEAGTDTAETVNALDIAAVEALDEATPHNMAVIMESDVVFEQQNSEQTKKSKPKKAAHKKNAAAKSAEQPAEKFSKPADLLPETKTAVEIIAVSETEQPAAQTEQPVEPFADAAQEKQPEHQKDVSENTETAQKPKSKRRRASKTTK